MEASMPLSPRAETIRKYSTWFMVYGVVLILLGAFAIIAPGIATLAIELMIGWLLLIGGVIGLVSVFTAGTSAPGFWWNLITAMVYVLAGIALLWSPIAGAITLTLILAAYLLAAGVAKVVLSLGYRKAIRGAWVWMLLSGLVDIVLGGLVIVGLPLTGLWVLGLLVGINLVFTGVALVIAAVHARRLASNESVPHRA
jgi:uncharacterized membrane protein HdeD (DUF308 family)